MKVTYDGEALPDVECVLAARRQPEGEKLTVIVKFAGCRVLEAECDKKGALVFGELDDGDVGEGTR